MYSLNGLVAEWLEKRQSQTAFTYESGKCSSYTGRDIAVLTVFPDIPTCLVTYSAVVHSRSLSRMETNIYSIHMLRKAFKFWLIILGNPLGITIE